MFFLLGMSTVQRMVGYEVDSTLRLQVTANKRVPSKELSSNGEDKDFSTRGDRSWDSGNSSPTLDDSTEIPCTTGSTAAVRRLHA